jgi:hypothetical protein
MLMTLKKSLEFSVTCFNHLVCPMSIGKLQQFEQGMVGEMGKGVNGTEVLRRLCVFNNHYSRDGRYFPREEYIQTLLYCTGVQR